MLQVLVASIVAVFGFSQLAREFGMDAPEWTGPRGSDDPGMPTERGRFE